MTTVLAIAAIMGWALILCGIATIGGRLIDSGHTALGTVMFVLAMAAYVLGLILTAHVLSVGGGQ